MLLNKNLADGEGKKSKLRAVVSSLNPANLFRSKNNTVGSVQAHEALEAKKMLEEEFADVPLPAGAIVDLHIAEVAQPGVQEAKEEISKNLQNRDIQKLEVKEPTKDIHRAEIQNLDESRAVASLKENINKLLANSADYQEVIESALIPAMIEDFGMGVLSAVNIDSLYSKWDEKNKLDNTLRVLDKLIQNKETERPENLMSRSMTVNVRGYSKRVEKPDYTAVYEKLKIQLLNLKFILNSIPEVKKIILENLIPELVEEGFTKGELFVLETEELKYHLYQVLAELIKFNKLNVRQEKLDLAQHALLSNFKPNKIPFGQQ